MFQDASKIPSNIVLAPIAEPFVVEYWHETYSSEEAYQLFVQEASKQGYGQCTQTQFRLAFQRTYLAYR